MTSFLKEHMHWPKGMTIWRWDFARQTVEKERYLEAREAS